MSYLNQIQIMKKLVPSISDNIADTLFITVYMRALDAQQEHPVLGDNKSLELMNRIDYSFEKYSGIKTMSRLGTCVRLKYIDNELEKFISTHQNTIVVNIGCGLDDRYNRIKNASEAIFYELDIPESIQLREQLIPRRENQYLIAESAFETDWLDYLQEKHPDSHFIFIAEGVFMYFPEEKVRNLLIAIANRFPESTVIFDGLSEYLSRHSDKHDTLRKAKAVFAWGFDDNLVFEKWHPALRVDKVFYIMHGMRPYNFMVRLLSYIPVFGKGSKIISLRVIPDQKKI